MRLALLVAILALPGALPSALAEDHAYGGTAPLTAPLGRTPWDFAHCVTDDPCFVVPWNMTVAVVSVDDASHQLVAAHWTLSSESGVDPQAEGDFCGAARIPVEHGRILSVYPGDLLSARRTHCALLSTTGTIHVEFS